MRSLGHPGRWRLLGLLAAVAVAVAIPAASGAGPFARAGSKQLCAHLCQSAALISPSMLGKAMHTGSPKALQGNAYTCTGGSIPAGTYSWLRVAGFCTVDQGIVKVKHSVTVEENAGLFAAFGGGSSLAVRGNLNVQSNGVLVLGCEPETFTCFNDPDQQVGTLSSKGTVFGSLRATNALAIIVHKSSFGHDVRIIGGGGGVNCDSQAALQGSPAYLTFEDTSVGHNVTITGWQSCWLGFFRSTVGDSFKLHNSITADPDGNEVQTNVVQDTLNCSGNNPAAQNGDSGGFLNVAFIKATGECVALTGP